MLEFVGAELRRLKMTVIWSWQGWRAAWRSEKTLRQWTLANVISAGLALTLDINSVERALIIGFGMLILVTELLNTAIEEAINRVSYAEHPLSKKAKDVGSAAVAVAAIATGLIWVVVLLG